MTHDGLWMFVELDLDLSSRWFAFKRAKFVVGSLRVLAQRFNPLPSHIKLRNRLRPLPTVTIRNHGTTLVQQDL